MNIYKLNFTLILKRSLQFIKSLEHDNINKCCLLVLDECVFQISSSYSVLKLRYRAPYSDYKIFLYLQQNHSSITLFTFCEFLVKAILPCDMG